MLLCQIFLCVTSFITTLAQETDNNSLCTLVLPPIVQVAKSKKISFGSQYAVQAGAHSAMVGWNSISDSILISFAHMSNTSYNPLTDTVTVQPGVHWGDAIAAIEPYGVSVVGGRARYCLLLGGGISFLSPLYGWSANSIKEVDVVLVTGELVITNTTNKFYNLFHTLKGGTNRFGIATRYELYAAHTSTKEDKDWAYRADKSYQPHTVDANVIIYLFYKGGSLPTNIFGNFLSIPNTSTSLSPLTPGATSEACKHQVCYMHVAHSGNKAHKGDEATCLNDYNHFMNFTRTFGTDLLAVDLIILPIPRSQWKSHGLNTIGHYVCCHKLQSHQPHGLHTTGFYVFYFSPIGRASSSPGLPLYINKCDASQNVFKTYPSFLVLQKMYAKYDPSHFNVQHTAGPIGL
ncbi:hypothetical protein B0H14DRAFT_2377419 [Mycena olivaceomarginata]|nr:hypothetical protein B0H14DRAFT_2377419 [Mycena olivaceomarginata]